MNSVLLIFLQRILPILAAAWPLAPANASVIGPALPPLSASTVAKSIGCPTEEGVDRAESLCENSQPNVIYGGDSIANVTGGLPPFLSPGVRAVTVDHIKFTGEPFPISGFGEAGASVEYGVTAFPVGLFPPSITPPIAIPIVAHLEASVEVRNEFGAGASASAFVFDPLTGVAPGVIARTPDIPAQSRTLPFFVVPGTALTVDLKAGAGVVVDQDHLFNRADAKADPLFSFDQAQFDRDRAALGLPTFPLDQFYAFEYSPGLFDLGTTVPVPEPPLLSLMAIGLCSFLGVTLARRR